MNPPAVHEKSGKYFPVLKALPARNLKIEVPESVIKCESSVAKTHSSLESLQIDISQFPSQVKAISDIGPFIMQPVPVQNLPVKTLCAVPHRHRRIKSHETVTKLQDVLLPDNSAVEGNPSKCQKLPEIKVSESLPTSEVKVTTAQAAVHTVSVQNLSTNTLCPSKTVKSSNAAVDTDTYESSESFQIYEPTLEITVSSTAQSSPILNLSTLVFLDLETTGLPGRVRKVQITELSMIAVSKSDFEMSQSPDLCDVRVMNKMCICVRPTVQVCPEAATITGLNDYNLLHHQTFNRDIANMIKIFIATLPMPICLLAHNGNVFDFPLLKAELQNAGVQLPFDILTADTLHAFRSTGSCLSSTNDIPVPTKKKKGENKTQRQSYALCNLYKKFFNQKVVNNHSAEGDCMALIMVCHKMKDKILPWICQNTRQFTSFKPMWN